MNTLRSILCALLVLALVGLTGCASESSSESSLPVDESQLEVVDSRPPEFPDDGDGPDAPGNASEDTPGPTAANASLLDVIAGSFSAKSFVAGSIDEGDLTAILEAGVRAPSARNSQPWHLSVVRSHDTVSQYVQNAENGNVLIIVSGQSSAPEGVNVAFDCGLATENIYMAAQALGYGAHIYTGPAAQANQNAAALGVPDGYEVVALVLVSQPDPGVDAVTGASARNDFDATVTYVD